MSGAPPMANNHHGNMMGQPPPPPSTALPNTNNINTPAQRQKSPNSLSNNAKLISPRVLFLDGSVQQFQISATATGQEFYDLVMLKVQLIECDYFDLEYANEEGVMTWLDHDKLLYRQTAANHELAYTFSVKFYSPHPNLLEDEYTRYLFALQIRKDIYNATLRCNDNTTALLAAFIVQSEIGDFLEGEYTSHNYLKTLLLVKNPAEEFLAKVRDYHQSLIGLSPAEADFGLLDTARKVEYYGLRLHPAKDHENMALQLCVNHAGILVYQHNTRINTFSWAKIRKLSFKRRKFLVKLHPEEYGYFSDTVEFYFNSRNECKQFWKNCIEHHAFFRCYSVKGPTKRTSRVLSRGSSFRYAGRTQKQLLEYMRDNSTKPPPYERSASLGRQAMVRHATGSNSSSSHLHHVLGNHVSPGSGYYSGPGGRTLSPTARSTSSATPGGYTTDHLDYLLKQQFGSASGASGSASRPTLHTSLGYTSMNAVNSGGIGASSTGLGGSGGLSASGVNLRSRTTSTTSSASNNFIGNKAAGGTGSRSNSRGVAEPVSEQDALSSQSPIGNCTTTAITHLHNHVPVTTSSSSSFSPSSILASASSSTYAWRVPPPSSTSSALPAAHFHPVVVTAAVASSYSTFESNIASPPTVAPTLATFGGDMNASFLPSTATPTSFGKAMNHMQSATTTPVSTPAPSAVTADNSMPAEPTSSRRSGSVVINHTGSKTSIPSVVSPVGVESRFANEGKTVETPRQESFDSGSVRRHRLAHLTRSREVYENLPSNRKSGTPTSTPQPDPEVNKAGGGMWPGPSGSTSSSHKRRQVSATAAPAMKQPASSLTRNLESRSNSNYSHSSSSLSYSSSRSSNARSSSNSDSSSTHSSPSHTSSSPSYSSRSSSCSECGEGAAATYRYPPSYHAQECPGRGCSVCRGVELGPSGMEHSGSSTRLENLGKRHTAHHRSQQSLSSHKRHKHHQQHHRHTNQQDPYHQHHRQQHHFAQQRHAPSHHHRHQHHHRHHYSHAPPPLTTSTSSHHHRQHHRHHYPQTHHRRHRHHRHHHEDNNMPDMEYQYNAWIPKTSSRARLDKRPASHCSLRGGDSEGERLSRGSFSDAGGNGGPQRGGGRVSKSVHTSQFTSPQNVSTPDNDGYSCCRRSTTVAMGVGGGGGAASVGGSIPGSPLGGEYSTGSRRIHKRRRNTERIAAIMKELLMTERTYKKDLEVICVWFRKAVASGSSRARTRLPQWLSKSLYALLDPIYDHHINMLKELDSRLSSTSTSSASAKVTGESLADISTSTSPHSSKAASNKIPGNCQTVLRVGDLFLSNAQMLPSYRNYFSHQEGLLSDLEATMRAHPEVELGIREFESRKQCYLPLYVYLLKPMHRLMHYRILLERLLRHYDDEHPDLPDCRTAHAQILDVLQRFRESYRRMENLCKLLELQRDLVGLERVVVPRNSSAESQSQLGNSVASSSLIVSPSLAEAGREFIREGWLQKVTKKGRQPRMFFLFSDQLIYASSTNQAACLQFKVHGQFLLRDVMVEECEVPQGFTLYCGTKQCFVLVAASDWQRDRWVEDISRAILAARSCPNEGLQSTAEQGSSTATKSPPERTASATTNTTASSLTPPNETGVSPLDAEASLPFPPPPPQQVEVTGKGESPKISSATPTESQVPQQRTNVVTKIVVPQRSNTSTHVCWHRNVTLSMADILRTNEYQISGYLLRKFKNSQGWQKLWIVFSQLCLFFYKNADDDAPLATLPLLGYLVLQPEPEDHMHKEHVFKLHFKQHTYFFRVKNAALFERWFEVLSCATSTSLRSKVLTAASGGPPPSTPQAAPMCSNSGPSASDRYL